mmetsp:Transcript_34740/g.99753  ORF Transcript_34740/g.99753 Transcript_34740/m.99753 type:complete len:87 (-) Transcript_34740:232-492(-)
MFPARLLMVSAMSLRFITWGLMFAMISVRSLGRMQVGAAMRLREEGVVQVDRCGLVPWWGRAGAYILEYLDHELHRMQLQRHNLHE